MAQVQGHCDPRFEEVKKLFQQNLDSSEECGAGITVNIDGENVVDIWGGHADVEHTRPWERDTITCVFSTSKTICALAALILIDRGVLDPFAKVSKYWPEFAANGKENVEVRHFLAHTSGVPGWDKPVTIHDVLDNPKAAAMLAEQAPWWEPGSAAGYHSITMGTLVGELVRRITGKTMKEFIAEEMAGPLGADFQLGSKEEDWKRTADMIPPPAPKADDMPPMDPQSFVMKVIGNPPSDAGNANQDYFRLGELGAANGHASAPGVARLLSVVSLGGEVDGKKWLSPKTIDLIFQEQAKGKDVVIPMMEMRRGIGYGLPWKEGAAAWIPVEDDARVCFWGGWGGSIGLMDLDRRMTISYVMNKMANAGLGNDCSKAYVKAIYAGLGVKK